MKCPKCNYNSFEYLASCKKCGYVFQKGKGYVYPYSISQGEPAMLKDDLPREKGAGKGQLPDVSSTVASIQSALKELEEEVQDDNGASRKPQQVKTFPSFNEVNWEESISLASDELQLSLDGETGEVKEGESDFTEDAEAASEARTTRLRKELARVDEELEQIEKLNLASEPFSYPGAVNTVRTFDFYTVPKGGFWIRFGANVIDYVVLSLINYVLTFIGIVALRMGPAEWEMLEGMRGEEYLGFMVPFTLCFLLVNVIYYTYFHGVIGQTPGKMVCKIKVVRTDGASLGYGRAFLRWIGYLISSFILCLGYMWVAWDKHKQGWHDKIAGTCVIKVVPEHE